MTVPRIFSIPLLAIMAFCFSCENKPDSSVVKSDSLRNIEYPVGDSVLGGTVEDGKYVNKYFGFVIPVPDSTWEILNAEQYENRLDDNAENMQSSETAKQATKENVDDLFTIRRVSRIDSMGLFQGVSFMREGIEKIPGVTNALDYVNWTDDWVKKNLSSGFPKYTSQGIDTAYVGDRIFLHATYKIETETGYTYFQETYTALFGKYLLNVIVNYQTDEEAIENMKYLSQIHWNK